MNHIPADEAIVIHKKTMKNKYDKGWDDGYVVGIVMGFVISRLGYIIGAILF